MTVKLLTEHHLEFLSLKGGCKGSSESTLVKMPHCWKSHAMAHLFYVFMNTTMQYIQDNACLFGLRFYVPGVNSYIVWLSRDGQFT